MHPGPGSAAPAGPECAVGRAAKRPESLQPGASQPCTPQAHGCQTANTTSQAKSAEQWLDNGDPSRIKQGRPLKMTQLM